MRKITPTETRFGTTAHFVEDVFLDDAGARTTADHAARVVTTFYDQSRRYVGEIESPIVAAVEADPAAEWQGVIALEGIPTGDGRIMEPGALRWADLPIPLRLVRADQGAHDGAVTVGRITSIERDGALIMARGDFDLASPEGVLAARLVADEVQQGISVDLDDVSFEVRLAKDVVDRIESDDAEVGAPERNADGSITIYKGNPDDEMFVTLDARIRAATLVAVPAFAEAQIAFTGDADLPEQEAVVAAVEESEDGDVVALVAAAPAADLPRSWFSNPELDGPTPMTIEGRRIFGHAALWESCHRGYADQCVTPPHDPAGGAYPHFRTGEVVTDDGIVATGTIALGGGHAPTSAKAKAAARWYDDVGTAVADIVVGEDAYGIWFSGAIREGVSDEDVRTLRASSLSGDWRRVGGQGLSLIALAAVNTPGFPVIRTNGLVASGEVQSLVAAGIVPAEIDEAEVLAARARAAVDRAIPLEDRAAAAASRVLDI